MSSLQRRVLMIGPSNIGDAILASDVVSAVSQRFTGSHVTLVVGERARAVFIGDPRIHTLVDADAFSGMARLQLAMALWRYHPHLVIDLRHTLYPLILNPLQAWRYLRQPPNDLVHMRARHLWKLGAQVSGADSTVNGACPLWFGESDIKRISELCRRWGLIDAPRLVVVCPGARSHIKRWTPEGFADVADRLQREFQAEIVFAGEPEEETVVETIRGLMETSAHSAVGLTTIQQLGVLMQRAKLVITNDSASLHLASAVRTPTLAIFGPTDESKYGPTAPRHGVVRRRLFCAPCEQALCRFNHECMRFITADEVFEAARQLLGS